jgi:hypothetical protein
MWRGAITVELVDPIVHSAYMEFWLFLLSNLDHGAGFLLKWSEEKEQMW